MQDRSLRDLPCSPGLSGRDSGQPLISPAKGPSCLWHWCPLELDWNPAPSAVPPTSLPASTPWGPREQTCRLFYTQPSRSRVHTRGSFLWWLLPFHVSHGSCSQTPWCVHRESTYAVCSPLTVESKGETAQLVRSRAATAPAWETLPVMQTAPGDHRAPSWPKRAATALQGIKPKVVTSSHFFPKKPETVIRTGPPLHVWCWQVTKTNLKPPRKHYHCLWAGSAYGPRT